MRYLGKPSDLISPSPLEIRNTGLALDAILESLPKRYQKDILQTKAQLLAKLQAGQVVDHWGYPYREADILLKGQTIFIFRTLPDCQELVPEISVLWQGEAATVIDKPSGLASIPRGKYVVRSAVYQARRKFINPQIIAAHRLDRLTSGCLLLVTDTKYRGAYQSLFQEKQVTKFYEALTVKPRNFKFAVGQKFSWKLRLYKPSGSLQVKVEGNRESVAKETGGKFTIKPQMTMTKAEILEVGDSYIRWELLPETGYTHQLRVTLNHFGFPILGDPLYPEIKSDFDLVVRRAKLALWAREISFFDPVLAKQQNIKSKIGLKPVDFY